MAAKELMTLGHITNRLMDSNYKWTVYNQDGAGPASFYW